jgi:hypothetical protein
MTVTKSNIITDSENLDVLADRGLYSAEKVVIAEVTTPTIVADNEAVLLCEIPVDAKITSIRMWSDDLGTTGDFNLGLYPGSGSSVTIVDDSDAVDEDCIALGIDVNAAALANVEQRFITANLTTASDKAWELAGLSARPDYATFYLAFTASEATTAAGDIAVITRYTQ